MTTITNLQTATRGSGAPKARGASVASFARAATATAYTAGDVISDLAADTPKCLVFPGCGTSGAIRGASLVYGDTKTANLELWLFDSEPTNFLDNAALALVAADMPKLVGVLSFADSGKTTLGTNLDYRPSTSRDPIPYTTAAAGSLYGLLVTRSAFTPASAAVVTARLRLEHD